MDGASWVGEESSVPVWCDDAAGPYRLAWWSSTNSIRLARVYHASIPASVRRPRTWRPAQGSQRQQAIYARAFVERIARVEPGTRLARHARCVRLHTALHL